MREIRQLLASSLASSKSNELDKIGPFVQQASRIELHWGAGKCGLKCSKKGREMGKVLALKSAYLSSIPIIEYGLPHPSTTRNDA